jgi:integrase
MAKTTKSSDGLKKIGPGKWLARIVGPRDADGKRTVDTDRIIEADTKMQAMQLRQKLYDELVGDDSEWTVEQTVAAWLPTVHIGSLPVRTTHINRFKLRFGGRRLSAVAPVEIQRWLAELDCGDTTANAHRGSVLALYKFARRQGRLVGKNPLLETEKRETSLSTEEELAALHAPVKSNVLIGDALVRFFEALNEVNPDLYPVAKTQLLLGCRWAEVAALQWQDIDWATGAVLIRRGIARLGVSVPKARRKRVAALGPMGIAFLRGHCAVMEQRKWPGWDVWVFPRPVTGHPRPKDTWAYNTVHTAVAAALAAAQIDIAKNTHAFRHTYVTLSRALNSDDVMRASVGHSGAGLTETYTDDSHRVAEVVSLAEAFEARLQNAGGGFGGVGSEKSLKNRDKRTKV